MDFNLTQEQRNSTWDYLIKKLEHYYSNTETYRASVQPNRSEVLQDVRKKFDTQREVEDVIDDVISGLSKHSVHTPHPNHYGLFNPRSNFPSIVADVITAYFNPQLAAWGHAAYAVEIEYLLIQEIGKKFGYTDPNIDGVFATGGQEAHITGMLCALNYRYKNYDKLGLRSLIKTPIVYCSESSHHATIKAARICGLGSENIKYIKVDDKQRMVTHQLESQIKDDIDNGLEPFFVFATMGTTGSGAMDPLKEIAKIAKEYNLWLHADAAYGGAIVLTEDYNYLLDGIEKSDSITFDAHKWLSVPMATSLFLTKHQNVLGKAFNIHADYIPEEENEIDKLSSYTHSIQWSRRFIGLKLYIPLLVFGWKGYDETINQQIKIGKYLRQKLIENNWSIYNETELPIICFNDSNYSNKPEFAKYIYESFLETGEAWITNYPVGNKSTLRACITNYMTDTTHIDKLINLLNKKRESYFEYNLN